VHETDSRRSQKHYNREARKIHPHIAGSRVILIVDMKKRFLRNGLLSDAFRPADQAECFSTLPDLMHWVQTLILFAPCAEETRTRCRLGSQTLRVLFIA
jgi:hypothetical protein